jgi:hypothetical protein
MIRLLSTNSAEKYSRRDQTLQLVDKSFRHGSEVIEVQHPATELFRLPRRIGPGVDVQPAVSKNRDRNEIREVLAFPCARATIGTLVSAHGIPDEFAGPQRGTRALSADRRVHPPGREKVAENPQQNAVIF